MINDGIGGIKVPSSIVDLTGFNFNDGLTCIPPGEAPKSFNQSFFRGENCGFNPYSKDFLNKDFLQRFILKGWVPEKPIIDKRTRITAFGSCFAVHIADHLSNIGYDLSKERSPKIHISTMGEGLVNVHAIAQQFEWALENIVPPQGLWHGYKCEEFGYDEGIRQKTRDVFLSTDFFILTLGLSEIWYDEQTGGIFWRAVPKEYYDESRHKFRVCTFAETKERLEKIYELIRKHVPNAKLLFALSPVPLAATFRPVSCLTANSTSKAILRAALDEFYRNHLDVLNQTLFYFPSFEVVSELFFVRYEEDGRHPLPAIIDLIMHLFAAVYCSGSPTIEQVEAMYQEMRGLNAKLPMTITN